MKMGQRNYWRKITINMVNEIRIPKENLIQFIKREAAGMIGVPVDQLVCTIFLQTDENHRPLDVIVDYQIRDPKSG